MNRPADTGIESPAPSIKPLLLRLLVAGLLLAAAVAALVRMGPGSAIPAAIGGSQRAKGQRGRPVTRTVALAQPSQASNEQIRERILGVWEDDYQGQRTLSVRSDGTATMVIEFEGWKARMFTPRLQIETTWTIDEGRFNRQTVGGEPADKVEFVKNRVGDRASDQIVKVTADRMILIDQDGETRYTWHRVR